MEIWIVDRIEDDIVILENNGNTMCIKKDELKINVSEGDVLIKDDLGKFVISKKEKNKREEYIKDLTENLWEN